jgi:hypothetical protein
MLLSLIAHLLGGELGWEKMKKVLLLHQKIG